MKKLYVIAFAILVALAAVAFGIHKQKGAIAFHQQVTYNLTHWPFADVIQHRNKDGEPNYFVRVALDHHPLLANNTIFAYQGANDGNGPRLVIWTVLERSKTDYKTVDEVKSYTVLRSISRFYVRTDGFPRYVLAETKVIDRQTAPKETPIPLFERNSAFGKWYFKFFHEWGNDNPRIPTETVEP